MSEYNIEQLLKKINELETELKSSRKYGLLWDKENTKEDVVIQCEKNIPILEQDKSKKIICGNNNNILIEGDNYHALASLNFVLKNSVDAIYIDPPYNTGNKDFIYNDRYIDSDDGYLHSKWLSFMQKRLILARELLKEDGIIFISIDDIELANLKLLCDSIFSESCFVSIITVEISKTQGMKVKSAQEGQIVKNHEYVLTYCKSRNPIIDRKCLYDSAEPYDGHFDILLDNNLNQSNLFDYFESNTKYSNLFKKYALKINKTGLYKLLQIDESFKREFFDRIAKNLYRKSMISSTKIQTLNLKVGKAVEYNGYILVKNTVGTVEQLQSFYDTLHMSDDYGPEFTRCTIRGALWKGFYSDMMNVAKEGSVEFKNGKKPKRLIKHLFKWVNRKNGLYLDFFAGSGTTGESLLDLNKEDGGNRRFILCTNNENNICTNVTHPRLKTVITGIRPDGTKYSDGIPSNLYYFKTDFIKDEANTEQAKFNLVEKVDSLLCIAEDVMEEVERNDYSSHFINGDKHLFIYNDFYNETKFDEFKQRVLSATGQKIVYVYASDNNIDETLIEGNDIELKPIPSKIYEIYKEIVEDIKRGE